MPTIPLMSYNVFTVMDETLDQYQCRDRPIPIGAELQNALHDGEAEAAAVAQDAPPP
jgi:hypothetical protein